MVSKNTTTTAAPAAAVALPTVAAPRADVPLPVKTNNRGRASIYDFDSLTVGQSIGVVGKTAKELYPTVNNANRRFKEAKVVDGATVFKTEEVTDPSTGIKSRKVSDKPEMVATRKFIVADVDPATDPDNATARIFREA